MASVHAQDGLPPRKILAIVTVGGATNSAPILEICKVLHERGHTIEFATLAGREHFAASYPFVSSVHLVGRSITPQEDEALYLRFCEWSFSKGQKDFMEGKKFHDAFWTETYLNLKRIIEITQPDFIFADYHVDAARDMQVERQIPLATMWPQMPWLMCPVSYISGQPGLQQRCLTNENASMWDRWNEEIYLLKSPRTYFKHFLWTKKMRQQVGVKKMLPLQRKPDYLVFVNSFLGLEVPKDLPPLVHTVGPILSDTYQPLDEDVANFLSSHQRVLYVAFGTHVILSSKRLQTLMSGIFAAIQADRIDGVIWAVRGLSREIFAAPSNLRVVYKGLDDERFNLSYPELLENLHPHIYFVEFAPQRAVLAHPSTRLFLTHAGPSSANEAIFHGVPMIAMGIYGDQLPNSMRLCAAGVAESLKKENFTATELTDKIGLMMRDEKGLYRRNIIRMQRIAIVASRRKSLAADFIEEVLYDHELRFQSSRHDHEWSGAKETVGNCDRGCELRPMHLQTADMRMSWFHARNLDLWMTIAFFVILIIALIVAIGLGAASKL